MKRDHAVLLAAGITLGAWTVAARTPPLAQADLAVTRWLQHYASPALDVIFSIITIAGNVEVTVVLAVLIAVALARRGRMQLSVALWAVFIGGLAVEWIVKHWLPHPGVPESLRRPGVNILHYLVRTPYSYPSGHAFRTMLLATAASWLRAQTIRWWRHMPYVPVAAVGIRGAAPVYPH